MTASDRLLPPLPPRRRRVAVVGLTAYAVLTVTDVVTELTGHPWLGLVQLAVMMPLLFTVVLVVARPSRLRTLLLVAVAFAWLGDVAGQTVLIKIGFFAVSQIAYCLAFWPLRRRSLLLRPVPLVGYAVLLATVIGFVAARAGGLVGPVIAYGVLLAAMVALASGVSRLTTVGAGLFLVSDIVLGYKFFLGSGDNPVIEALVMATYLPAQLLIVLGAVRGGTLPKVDG